MSQQHRPLLITLAFLAFLARIVPGARTVDDAFITFRYSRNIVEGNGFVYNLGDKVLGTTTPLYTLLMAVIGAVLGDNYPLYALVVNALAGAVSTVIIFLLVYHFLHRTEYAIWIASLWAVAPYPVTFAIGGMETSVHNAFMLASWLAYVKNRPRWLGALIALGVLTRPDALLWAAPLLLHQVWYALRHRNDNPTAPPTSPRDAANVIRFQTWLTGLIVFMPWVIFAAAYFGSPIPHTITTKAAVYDVKSTQALEIFLRLYATPFQDTFVLGSSAIKIGIILYPTLSFIGIRYASSRDSRALPIMLYAWLYFLVFVLLNPLIFRWYTVPPLPAYFMAIGCGVYALLKDIPNPRLVRTAFAAIAALTLYFGMSAWMFSPDHGPDRPAPQMAFHEIELNYKKMAERLEAEHGLTENSVVAIGDIGSFGFYSRAYILDTIGLVTEGTTSYYDNPALEDMRIEESNYVVPPDLIMDWQPDYVVLMEGFIRNGLLKDERFLEQYTLVEEIPTDYYGTGMLAFQRNSE